MCDQGFDRVERRIHRAVAGRVCGNAFAVDGQTQGRLLRTFGAAHHTQVFHLDAVLARAFLILHQRDQVVVIDFLLAVRQRLEPHKHVGQLVVGQLIAQLTQLGPQRGPAGVFAHHKVRLRQAHVLRAHNLKRFRVLEHPVLVDTAFVRKGVLADDRFVELHREPRNRGYATRNRHQLGRLNPGGVGHDIAAHLQGHHNLFEGGVARALTQAVDCAFDLARAALNCGQRVCSRHAKVVVTMRGENHSISPGYFGDQTPDQVRTFTRCGVAHGVGDVDRGCAGLDRNLNNARQIIPLGPGRIHRRPLYVVTQVAGMGDRFVDLVGHLIHGEVRDGAVQRRGADKRVNAWLGGVFHGLKATVDVFEVGPCKPADHRILRPARNLGNGFKIAVRGDGKARFDNIYTHFVEHLGDFDLFVMGHGGAGALLTVAQCGVENYDFVFVCLWRNAVLCHGICLYASVRFLVTGADPPLSGRAKRHAQRRLRSRLASRRA